MSINLTPEEREAVLYALRSAVTHQVLPPEKAGALVAGLAKLEDAKSDIEATPAKQILVLREMAAQGVVSDNDLKGPLGDEIRAERKPYFEELVRQGKMAPSVLTKFW